jgi:hypothetical protein
MNDAARGSMACLAGLVGQELEAVIFIKDYLQFQFHRGRLSAVTLPTVRSGREELRAGAPGYHDALCERIGRTIIKTEVIQSLEIAFHFDDGSVIAISLLDEDRVAPEAAILHHDDGGCAAIW